MKRPRWTNRTLSKKWKLLLFLSLQKYTASIVYKDDRWSTLTKKWKGKRTARSIRFSKGEKNLTCGMFSTPYPIWLFANRLRCALSFLRPNTGSCNITRRIHSSWRKEGKKRNWMAFKKMDFISKNIPITEWNSIVRKKGTKHCKIESRAISVHFRTKLREKKIVKPENTVLNMMSGNRRLRLDRGLFGSKAWSKPNGNCKP